MILRFVDISAISDTTSSLSLWISSFILVLGGTGCFLVLTPFLSGSEVLKPLGRDDDGSSVVVFSACDGNSEDPLSANSDDPGCGGCSSSTVPR